MKMYIYLLEQAVLLISWEILYKKMFPQRKLQRRILGVTYSVLTIIFFIVLGQTISKQLGPLFVIGISAGIVFAISGGKETTATVEALIAYMMTKTIWLFSVLVGFSLSRGLRKTDLLIESVFICAAQICLVLLVNRYSQQEWWKIIVKKYWTQIVIASSALFMVSYSIVLVPYNQEKWELHLYAFFVALITTIVLLIWVFNDYQHRKELEAQTQHINDLVRMAHRYKEIIPAVSQELRRIAEKTGNEISPELGVAIEEVEALQKSARRLDQEELKETPNLDGTGLPMLDSQLRQEWEEARERGVTFECVVMTPAKDLLDRDGVELFHLMQLVGDLFRNALRAIEREDGGDGRALLVLGRSGQGYELKLRDSGDPFPREVLERLGERGLTTGGTGHGMADTLELLAHYRASLEIREEQPGSLFTKTVCICFDGRGLVKVDWPGLDVAYERPLREAAKV